MKNNPSLETPSLETALRNALAARAGLVAEIENLGALSITTAEQLTKLECIADFADTSALAEITRLQTISELLPRRTAAREQSLVDSNAALLRSAHAFVDGELGPLGRRLEARLRARVEEALKPHFAESVDLERAVESSATMQEISRLQCAITIRNADHSEVATYAQRLLDVAALLRGLDIDKPAALAA